MCSYNHVFYSSCKIRARTNPGFGADSTALLINITDNVAGGENYDCIIMANLKMCALMQLLVVYLVVLAPR